MLIELVVNVKQGKSRHRGRHRGPGTLWIGGRCLMTVNEEGMSRGGK